MIFIIFVCFHSLVFYMYVKRQHFIAAFYTFSTVPVPQVHRFTTQQNVSVDGHPNILSSSLDDRERKKINKDGLVSQ